MVASGCDAMTATVRGVAVAKALRHLVSLDCSIAPAHLWDIRSTPSRRGRIAGERVARFGHSGYDPQMSGLFQITEGDAVAKLRLLPAQSVDLVITDPAYESLEKHRAIGTTTRLKHSKASSNDWFSIFPNRRFPELFEEIYRVLREDSHFYLFCDAETMFIAKPIGEAKGFKFWKPIVWDKKSIGMGYHYRARYEFILFFEKGKRKLVDLSVADILQHNRIWKGYPTEKPVGVSEVLVRQSSSPRQVVLDPFCGSGSVGVAAMQNDRNFVGIDLAPEAMAVSRRRIAAAGGFETDLFPLP